jgi:hypothetical protein
MAAEMRKIFGSLGLTGDFWDPQSDAFGKTAGGPAAC